MPQDNSHSQNGILPNAWYQELPVWGWLLLGLLVGALAVPGIGNWFEFLAKQSFQQNLVQILTVSLLGVSLARSNLRLPFRYKPSPIGFLFFVFSGFAYLAGAILSIKTLFWGGLIVLLATLLWSLSGFRILASWLPVVLFSFFLLPDLPSDLKNTISLPLQLLSTQLTTLLAGLFIPITAKGNIFYIYGEAFEVTVACSGLHTWIGFLFAGMMWLLFEKFSLKILLAALLSAPLLALVTNTLRLFITALVAHWVSADAAVDIHTNLEYLLFPLGLIALWMLLRTIYNNAESHAEGLCQKEVQP